MSLAGRGDRPGQEQASGNRDAAVQQVQDGGVTVRNVPLPCGVAHALELDHGHPRELLRHTVAGSGLRSVR